MGTHDVVQLPHQRSRTFCTLDPSLKLPPPRRKSRRQSFRLNKLRCEDIVLHRRPEADILRHVESNSALEAGRCVMRCHRAGLREPFGGIAVEEEVDGADGGGALHAYREARREESRVSVSKD
jgi:hypothetical protein